MLGISNRFTQDLGRRTLSSLHDERNTLPSVVVDVKNHGSKGRALGSLGDRVVVKVSGLVTGSGVLTQ